MSHGAFQPDRKRPFEPLKKHARKKTHPAEEPLGTRDRAPVENSGATCSQQPHKTSVRFLALFWLSLS
jgi:hypothetical protein